MSLGARLTRLRLAKGQSLQEVADAVGVSKAHIWELEKGRTDNPSMALVSRLADHFGLSLAAMVGEDPSSADAGKIGRMFRQAGDLDPDDLALLEDMMRTMLKRRKKSGSTGS
jgi:transcriptional regulator with XRE-family HTH domain